jgi:hypothetical protein
VSAVLEKRLAEKRSLYYADVRPEQSGLCSIAVRRFGSWAKALELFGIAPL